MTNYVTPQQVADFEFNQRLKRERLTLLQQPFSTLYVFLCGTLSFGAFALRYSVSHPVFLYFLLPAVILWFILEYIPGPLTKSIDQIEFAVEYFCWWVGLGVLSSIGLGSGLQSGVLFLYPHIIKVFFAAQTCKTLDFESVTDIWFRTTPNQFRCPELTFESTPVTFWGTWWKIIMPCFLQASGTAFGEIPPFFMTRTARLAAIEAGTSNPSEMPEELDLNSKWGFINRAKSWMIHFLEKHGFYGVLFMASYPNIAFDLCGICCGHFLMPFWTFLAATFIGKAIIRNGYQSLLYVTVCSEKYLELFIQLLQYLAPDGLKIDEWIREVLEEGRSFFQNMSKEKQLSSSISDASVASSSSPSSPSLSRTAGETFMFYWQGVMAVLLAAFALSCISQFAQYYQLTIDQVESQNFRSRLEPNVRLDISSPSGRLILPPPTPSHSTQSLDKLLETSKEAQQKIHKAAPPLPKSSTLPSVASSAATGGTRKLE